jgi:hypothetical protein
LKQFVDRRQLFSRCPLACVSLILDPFPFDDLELSLILTLKATNCVDWNKILRQPLAGHSWLVKAKVDAGSEARQTTSKQPLGQFRRYRPTPGVNLRLQPACWVS